MSFEWQSITSKSNPLLVRMAKLKDKKYRKQESLFKFDGIKLFLEAAKFGAPIEYVFVAESAADRFAFAVDETSIKAKRYIVSDDAFSKLTDEASPEGIVTVCGSLPNIVFDADNSVLEAKGELESAVLLESIRDAGNMGTVLRSARAFGIDILVISSDCADLYNPKTVRGAMGALFTQRIVIVSSVQDAVAAIRKSGSRVFAAALHRDASRLGSLELLQGDAILIGNEGHGLSDGAIEACDGCLMIPMEENTESLNASIAASVCMWELYKLKN